jgi:hypothetical protein
MWKAICNAAAAAVVLLGLAAASPALADDADFSGSWDTNTDKGWSYQIEMTQKGDRVTGTWVAVNDGSRGQLSGRVNGGQLQFVWKQGEFTGTAQFSMADDGNSFTGVYETEEHPSLPPEYLTGVWSGERKSTSGGNFAGTWSTKTDKGWTYHLILAQEGNEVTGTYQALTPEAELKQTGSISGVVNGRVLKFDWHEEKFDGTGQFTLSADGKRFTGVYRSDPNPELPPEYQQGQWGGVRVQF